MTAAVRKPHVHAEVIHAFADGAQIEYRAGHDNDWTHIDTPVFDTDLQYRVKPEKAYPLTQLTARELTDAFQRPCESGPVFGFESVANAAIRHACESQQVIPMPEVQEVARNLNAEQHKKELQAVAEAVYLKCLNAVTPCSGAAAHELRKHMDGILSEVNV